jgi:hypothetical protein
MDRLTNEANYVLENLCRVRQEVSTHPELFEPDAVERIDKAIAAMQEVRAWGQSRLKVEASQLLHDEVAA